VSRGPAVGALRVAPPGALLVVLAAALLALGGCSSTKTKTTTAAKKNDKPMVLVPLANRIAVQRVWSAKLAGEQPKLRLGLDVAASDDRVFAANHKGVVEAFVLATGKPVWHRALKAPLSAGPTAAHGLVAVGSSKGEVIALSAADGQVRWRVHINAEILGAPAIADDQVIVRGVDGKLHGLSGADGSELWIVDQQVPRLSLRGTSRPTLIGDIVVCGFDNGRVMAVARHNGATAWDATIGQSHGSTELARLSDVDATVMADGGDLFAIAYQGHVARLTLESGQVVWTRDMSSYRGLAVDDQAVYISTAEGEVVRLERNNGTEQWRQKALARRQLTAPVLYGGRLVVADGGGVVHWLDPATGDFEARALVGKAVKGRPLSSKGIKVGMRVSDTPLVAGGLLLVFSDAGVISAFRTAPAPGAPTTAATASPLPGASR
jgi:outer membrane protein assembly factor BamB